MMQYILIVLLAVLAILILSEKAGWLIAGYNTMSDNDRQKYNYKRLCRVIGGCIIAIDILLIISCAIGEAMTDKMENVFSFLEIAIAILTVILANTICRKK